jgi:glutathione S-transferase
MTLTLFHHPLASFCHKVSIALYENGTEFERVVVDLGDKKASEGFFAMWPIGKIPVLRDEERGETVPETSIIIEYLEQHYPGPKPLLPRDEKQRLETRLWDRFFDLYVQTPMQKVVADELRGPGEKDPRGVADAYASLQVAYGMLDARMRERTWVMGEAFSMADCAAAPALFYADTLAPLAPGFPNAAAYFDRLATRPSFVRTLAEARPFFPLYPFAEKIPARFR